MARYKTQQEVLQDKADNVLNAVAKWASFYRCNPQRFAKDFLNVRLRLFQKILLYAMMQNNYVCYIASRGQYKKLNIVFRDINKYLILKGSLN